ncbi:unnamed protein product [Symbiodinium natans]|uniref:CCZ1/INTU/HSP4 first Longin domain-containing protein n=1 Tax=Symbiodinium natans TaxID=878477 RepID=A0A812J6V0_9DINO|nr:unnamed protein product [Symbiodinium natans]
MIEGLISFTAQFSGLQGPLRHIRTKQLAFSVLEVEPQIWMVLVMRHAMVNADSRGGEPKFDEESLPESTLQAYTCRIIAAPAYPSCPSSSECSVWFDIEVILRSGESKPDFPLRHNIYCRYGKAVDTSTMSTRGKIGRQAVAAYLQNPEDAIPEELLQEELADEEADMVTA